MTSKMIPKNLRRRDQVADIEEPDDDENNNNDDVVIDVVGDSNATSAPVEQLSFTDGDGDGDGDDTDNNDYNIFGHYISPCEFRVSNDPLLVAEEEMCEATIYGCVRNHTFLLHPSESDGVKELPLQYDYDMYYQYSSQVHDFSDMVEFLEGAMLEHLASLLELKLCPPDDGTASDRYHDGRRLGNNNNNNGRLLQGYFSDELKSVVIAINSEPRDVKSAEYDCMVAPEAGTMCQSMLGSMIVYVEEARVSEAGEAAVTNAILGAIKSGMETDVYVKDAIKGLVYIGERRPSPSLSAGTLGPELTVSPTIDATTEFSVVAASGRDQSKGGGTSGLGGTQIGLISAAAAFVVLVAIVGLFISSKRRKVESTTNHHQVPVSAKLVYDDGALEGLSERSRMERKRKLARARSLEGAEIPGSLAAMDALALKPQFRRVDEDPIVAMSDSERSSPATPPRIERTTSNSNNSPSIEEQLATNPQFASNRSIEIPRLTIPLVPLVPLSPVRNKKSGVSPSQVSPKRLPANLNEPFVSAHQSQSPKENNNNNNHDNHDNNYHPHRHTMKVITSIRDSLEFAAIDELVAEIEAQHSSPRLGGSDGGGGDTIKTLRGIAYNASGDSTSSFQDTDSGDSSRLSRLYQKNSKGSDSSSLSRRYQQNSKGMTR